MKTTIELDDALVRRAKMFAIEHGTTLRQFVEEALAVCLDQPSSDATAAAQERARHIREALEEVRPRRGMNPGADLPRRAYRNANPRGDLRRTVSADARGE